MRDPKRIDRILNFIGEYWKKHPDQRFGQMMINGGIIEDSMIVWNAEDKSFEEFLEELVKDGK